MFKSRFTQSARFIIEVYIMMKYLFLKEADTPDIWNKYKTYGIGKYKLILLKLREGMGNETTHVVEPILNALVNEPLLEKFTEIDLKYFDKRVIREKAISIILESNDEMRTKIWRNASRSRVEQSRKI